MSDASTKPYLIRAIHEWCSDNGYTPYLAVAVDQTTQVPREYVNDGEIVLNVSLEATNKLQLGNEYVEFQARFGGKARDILIPIANVSAIYARENGHGMSFEVTKSEGVAEVPPEGVTGGAIGLASVKPSSPLEGRASGAGGVRRSSPRKLKSVSTGERSSESSKPSIEQNAEERKEPSRSASAPRALAESQKKIGTIAEVQTNEGSIKTVPEQVVQASQEIPADPGTDPKKPTSGKPRLTRVK